MKGTRLCLMHQSSIKYVRLRFGGGRACLPLRLRGEGDSDARAAAHVRCKLSCARLPARHPHGSCAARGRLLWFAISPVLRNFSPKVPFEFCRVGSPPPPPPVMAWGTASVVQLFRSSRRRRRRRLCLYERFTSNVTTKRRSAGGGGAPRRRLPSRYNSDAVAASPSRRGHKAATAVAVGLSAAVAVGRPLP